MYEISDLWWHYSAGEITVCKTYIMFFSPYSLSQWHNIFPPYLLV